MGVQKGVQKSVQKGVHMGVQIGSSRFCTDPIFVLFYVDNPFQYAHCCFTQGRYFLQTLRVGRIKTKIVISPFLECVAFLFSEILRHLTRKSLYFEYVMPIVEVLSYSITYNACILEVISGNSRGST